MITCTICGLANDDLAVICAGCKSYIQAKVDSLNLFETAWGIVETPRATFKKVALARTKNYVLLLSALMGISLVYAVFWYWSVGKNLRDLVSLLGLGILIGPIGGVLFLALLGAYFRYGAALLGGRGTVRNNRSVAAYAMVPVAVSLLVVFPLEIALFGIYLFDPNPSAFVINPTAFVILVGLDGLATVWSILLLVPAVMVANGLSRMRGAILVTVAVLIAAGGVAAIRPG